MFNINLLWHVFQFVIFLVLFMIFMHKVFEDQLVISHKKFWVLAFIHIIVLSLITCLFFTQVSPYRQFSIIGDVLITVLSIILYKTVTRKHLSFLFFILFVLLNIQANAIILARATLDFHIIPNYFSYENGTLMLVSSVYCIILFFFVYASLAGYYKRIVDDNMIMKYARRFFFLPLIFFITLCVLDVSMMRAFSRIPKELFVPLLFLNVFSHFSYYAVFKSIIDNYDAAMEREKLSAAQHQLNLWESQYKNLQNKIDADARIRHDWRHHIIAIMGYVENKDLDGLNAYMADYKKKYLLPEGTPLCDIPSLNMLFQHYMWKAKESDISLSVSNVVLETHRISDSELIILFGNLLENALEACGKTTDSQKYILLKIIRRENKIVLLCENSYDGIIREQGNQIVSRKENGGIGLSSIRGIVQKYNGQMKIENAGKVFRIRAYLED